MTIRLCQELLPADKAEQTVAKLQKKKAKDWPKVRSTSQRQLPCLLHFSSASLFDADHGSFWLLIGLHRETVCGTVLAYVDNCSIIKLTLRWLCCCCTTAVLLPAGALLHRTVHEAP
jgi:hypothetical protein